MRSLIEFLITFMYEPIVVISALKTCDFRDFAQRANDFLIALRIWEECRVAFRIGHLEHASRKQSIVAATLLQLT